MSYLTYEEFQQLTGSDMAESDFAKLLIKASLQLDGLTNDFYRYKHDLNAEATSERMPLKSRASDFKRAIGATIEFMYETGITSKADQYNAIQGAVSIGRTRVEAPDLKRSLIGGWVVPIEYATMLGRHGLLYRGFH